MRKKTRKCRKLPLRVSGRVPSANKENNFGNIFCRRGDVQDIRPQPTEPVTSCSSSKKQSKKMKTAELALQKQCSDNNTEFLSLPSRKISAVSFFIPLNEYARSYQKEVPTERIIDWSNLIFYGCSNAAMLSYYPNEQVQKMYYYKPTILPELRLRCQSMSESSTNSEDSFICFENENASEEDHDYSPGKFDRRSSDQNEASTSSKCGKLLDTEKSKKKKVQFVDNSALVTTHVIIAWDYAYRAARISEWETMARDSNRFKQKIRSLEPILSPILNSEHRAKIWETRMRNDEP